tara:strand:+ start:29 stop:337 length:309 start_codon:yes stop_codon:yes gene_type:complete
MGCKKRGRKIKTALKSLQHMRKKGMYKALVYGSIEIYLKTKEGDTVLCYDYDYGYFVSRTVNVADIKSIKILKYNPKKMFHNGQKYLFDGDKIKIMGYKIKK